MKARKSSSDHHKVYSWGLPALSGGLLALSLPPLPFGPIAWVGLLPLFRSLERQSYRGGFGLGYRAGVIYYLGSLYWIILNTGATPILRVLSLIGVLIILPFIWGISTWLIGCLRRHWGPMGWLFAPLVWTAVEVIFSIGESGFPWAIFALSQSRFLDLIQFTEVTGVHGVTFWVVAINAIGMLAWRETKTKPQAAALLLVIVLWILIPASWGRHRRGNLVPAAGTINVGLVQGNIEPEEKWSMGVEYSLTPYEELSASLSEEPLQLIVWPETAVPTHLAKRWHYRQLLQRFIDSLQTPLLTGANDYEIIDSGDIQRFNAAFLVTPGEQELQTYHKIHPVPFGERIPFQRLMPFLGLFRLGQAEFTPGSEFTVFTAGDGFGKFSAMICFESIFPYVSRRFVQEGAEFLVNITNDGWFGRCSEPYQHLELTKFRSIETRRWLVRAANTGISAVIAPDGSIQDKSPLLRRSTLAQTIECRRDITFFVRNGNWFAMFCGVGSFVPLIAVVFIRRKDLRR